MTLSNEMLQIVAIENKNPNIRGFVENKDGTWIFDRRYTADGIWNEVLNPRNADFDIIGPETVRLTAAELALVQSVTVQEDQFIWGTESTVTFNEDNPYNGD